MNIKKIVIAIFIILAIIFSIYVTCFHLIQRIGSNDHSNRANAIWGEVTNISKTEGKLIIGKVLEPDAFIFNELKFIVSINGTEAGYIYWNWTNSDIQSINWKNSPPNAVVTFIDNNELNVHDEGDVILLSGLKPDTTYKFEYFDINSDGMDYMTGNNSFTTPP